MGFSLFYGALVGGCYLFILYLVKALTSWELGEAVKWIVFVGAVSVSAGQKVEQLLEVVDKAVTRTVRPPGAESPADAVEEPPEPTGPDLEGGA